MKDYKLTRRINDIILSNKDKKILIVSIGMMQRQRWVRLKGFHSSSHIPMHLRHFLMKREIELIRSQRERQQQLIDDLIEDEKL